MNQLEEIFKELGISQYLGAFVDQGFDSWDTILDITESDLDVLGVKLGHRRKLQRRIANHRGLAPATSLVSPTRSSIEDPTTNVPKLQPQHHEVKDGTAVAKRKYRRHPKPDENAPERPPSAYVLFSNKMREDLKGQNLSFTEIAKLVGENWQSLDRAEKEPFETQAQELKARYNRDMIEYKKTVDYKRYSDYLQDFRKRQALHDAHKRARMDGDGNGRRTAAASHAPSATTSNAGSGSESQPGSEPPPTRQQRLSSIASQSDAHMSPIISSHAFPRHADDASHSPMSVVQDEKAPARARGFSSPGSRDLADPNVRRHSSLREGVQPDASLGYGFPSLSQPGDSRVAMATVSLSPEGGFPSIVPNRPEDTRSGRTSISSQFWSRPPSLRAEPSSTGSISSLSSFTQPRTPSESSLPIHALLSSKPETPTMHAGGLPLPDSQACTKPPAATQQYSGRPPGDQFNGGRPPYTNGIYSSGMGTPTQVVMAPLLSPVAQPTSVLPRINGASADLDGMSALLRASDIVGRPGQ